MTKRRIMVSIPDDVIDAMTLQVDGVEVRSLSHLIEILCSREAAQAANRTEARKRRRKTKPTIDDVKHAIETEYRSVYSVKAPFEKTHTKKGKHATKKKARAK